jgi:hypothetical protein
MKIAAAVSGILAAAAAPSAFAAYTGEPAAQTAAAAAAATFWTGGSSAAVSGFGTGVGADVCQAGTLSTFVTIPGKVPAAQNPGTPIPAVGTPDFRLFSCTASAALPALAGQTINIAYRADGGSVVGAFAPLNNAAVNELNIATAWCTADATTAAQYDCATTLNATVAVPAGAQNITGTTTANGPKDTYTGALVKHTLYYGISDLEPGVFGNTENGTAPHAGGGNDDPLNPTLTAPYPYTFLGADASTTTLQNMSHTLIFQQTFGWVASTNLGISDISSADLAAILSQQTTDWGKIPKTSADGAAGPVAAAGTKINVCQRDLGSGTRSSADVVFTGDGCNPYGAQIKNNDAAPLSDNFSTPDELACVNGTANSIGYVSVDNFTKAGAVYPNVRALTLDGRTASNAQTATGSYQYAVEASINKNSAYAPTANETTFFGLLVTDLQAFAKAPQSAQVNALPGHAGNASNNGTVQVNGKINVTSFARDTGAGNSCSLLNLK